MPESNAPHAGNGGSVSPATTSQQKSIVPVSGQEIFVGRDPQCDVVLNDPAVSRRHASIRSLDHGGCIVTDLDSSAGSFINGHRFDSQELTVGDRLRIGPFTFQYDGSRIQSVTAAEGSAITAAGIIRKIDSRRLLDEVSFTISGSFFVGILGPSGAGKSTLLHALAGLEPPQGGAVFIGTRDVYDGSGANDIGFVPQDDIVHRELTVSQALRYSARLRLPARTPQVELEKLKFQTLDQLGLRSLASRPIHRLSGGQRKRVSVAVELLAKPAVLFLDEPSSGLDPATEFQLMELLRELTNTGCTVVCTTHVMENAYLMDELLVVYGGCLAFQGSVPAARDYFGVAKLHALYERLEQEPPAAWKQRRNASSPPPALPARPDSGSHSAKPARRAFALPILLQRQWAILSADWRNFVILLIQPLIIGSLVAWVVTDQSLALFFGYIAALWFGCSNAAQEIVKERPIFQRERLIGIGSNAYLLSKFSFLSTITCIQALILYATLHLCSGGLQGAPQWQLAALLGAAVCAVAIGCAISAVARSVMQAVLAVPLLLIPQILFSGHPVPAHEMTPAVYAVSRAFPTFSAQTLADTSFLWNQKIERSTLSDHWTSFRNLNRDDSLHTGDLFLNARPALFALGVDAAWIVGSYLLAILALGSPKRQKRSTKR